MIQAFKVIGLKKGDTLFSHANIGFFGIPKGPKNVENAFHTILNALFEVIGSDGTLVVPTFTYSFSQSKIFDPDNSPSDCGIFTELLRLLPNSYRSEHPCISVTAYGAKASVLTQNISQNGYDENSFFSRFYQYQGKICNLNFDSGSTFIHYVERLLRVPYRFDKTFTGIFMKKEKKIEKSCTIWVRHLVKGTEAKFEKFDKLSRLEGFFKTAPVGRGFVGSITANSTYELIKRTIPSLPWFLTEADALGIIPDLPFQKKKEFL